MHIQQGFGAQRGGYNPNVYNPTPYNDPPPGPVYGGEVYQQGGQPRMARTDACAGLSCKLIIDLLILFSALGNFFNLGLQSGFWFIPWVLLFIGFCWGLYCLCLVCGRRRDQSTHSALITYSNARFWFGVATGILFGACIIVMIVYFVEAGEEKDDRHRRSDLYVAAWSLFAQSIIHLFQTLWFCISIRAFKEQVEIEHAYTHRELH